MGEMMTEAEDIVLMQYTGLKDKNDKEIYEGDIVKAWVSLKDMCLYAIPHKDCQIIEAIGEVRYWPPYFEIKFNFTTMELEHCCEVIGNIYENPELLNQ